MSDTVNSLANYVDRLSPYTKNMLVATTHVEFDTAFDYWLEHGISKLEASGKLFAELGEDALSSILALTLSTGEVNVTRETHSNGHVDLTVTLPNRPEMWVKLGEAKIWHGDKYHVDGLGQLLNRYTTGRECRGFVISYVKIKDIKNLFINLRQYIDDNKSFNLEDVCADHNIRWSFLSNHTHSSGEVVEVCHVGCNLYV